MNKRNRVGIENPNYQDGKTISHNYVVLSSKIWGDNHGRYEHRVIMERELGRPLTPQEVVHHKNGNTLDNRLENLEVMTRLEHNRTHGNGKIVVCVMCGAEKWYSAANIARLRNQGSDHHCRACSVTHKYDKTCQRCQEKFTGGRTALFCANCTKKNRGRK